MYVHNSSFVYRDSNVRPSAPLQNTLKSEKDSYVSNVSDILHFQTVGQRTLWLMDKLTSQPRTQPMAVLFRLHVILDTKRAVDLV